MLIVDAEYIKTYFSNFSFDVRQSHNGRWIDQKCTPDVVCIVSDCILNYVQEKGDAPFSSVEIWHFDYTKENVQEIFSKPDLDSISSRNEYDKYFQQPMEMLVYSHVLKKEKRGNRNFYQILNEEILRFISIRERDALTFLQLYIAKVLIDSGIIHVFDSFFEVQTPEAYLLMKEEFENFTIQNTPINGKTECRRIFTKVLNPLAFQKRKLGTERGHVSNHPITYDVLMYNRDNFRDLYADKPKGMTRQDYAELIGFNPCNSYTKYASAKAKRNLKAFNDEYREGLTELLLGAGQDGPAVHMHHIFPEARFPEISGYYENLIVLTPTQHLSYAHLNGNTRCVSKTYQYLCLIAKTDSIEANLLGQCGYILYEFAKYKYVLNLGLSTNEFESIEEMDFQGIRTKIEHFYSH